MQVDLSSLRLSTPLGKVLVAAISAVLILIISGFIFSNKEVSLKVDGRTRRLVTRAGTVADLLAEQKIKVSSHDKVDPALNTQLLPETKVAVFHTVPVVIEINGKSRKLWPVAATVAEVVEGIGIDTSADIKLEPGADTRVASGMTIHVKLLNRWIEKIQTEIGYETKREDDNTLAKGRTRVASKGQPGVRETVVEHVMASGREIEKIVRSENIVKGPVAELVKVGTRVPRAVVASVPGPGINVSRGGRSLTMLATAYASGSGGAGWRTATGTGVYKGIVAVDPRVIPLGTKLYIDGYGPAVAADTGGAIKGNRIDLGFGSHAEAIQFGRRSVTVHIAN